MVVRWIQTRNIGPKRSARCDAPGGASDLFWPNGFRIYVALWVTVACDLDLNVWPISGAINNRFGQRVPT